MIHKNDLKCFGRTRFNKDDLITEVELKGDNNTNLKALQQLRQHNHDCIGIENKIKVTSHSNFRIGGIVVDEYTRDNERGLADSMFFKKFGNGHNFITPSICNRGLVNKDTAFELSHGIIMGDDLFGVTTVVTKDGFPLENEGVSKSFNERVDAENYIETLKREE